MANAFSLKLDHRDNRTEIIECMAQGFSILVHPPSKREYDQELGSLILTGMTYYFESPGKMDLDKTIHYDFEIMNVEGPCSAS